MSLRKRNGIKEFFELIFGKKRRKTCKERKQDSIDKHFPDVIRATRRYLSLDAPIGFSDRVTITLGDTIGDSTDADRIREKVNFDYWLDGILEKLPKLKSKHRKLVQLLRNGYSPKQVAQKLRIGKSGVSFLLQEFRDICIKNNLLRYRSVKVKCILNCRKVNCTKCYFTKRLIIE